MLLDQTSNEITVRRMAAYPAAEKEFLHNRGDKVWELLQGLRLYEVNFVLRYIEENHVALMKVKPEH